MSITALLAAAAIALPGFHVARSAVDGGTLLQGTIPDARIAQKLNPGFVYLPPGFSPSRRYPVVYLLHGMPGSPLEYAHGLGLLDWADAQIEAGALRPFIAVVPSAAQRTSAEWAGVWEDYLVDAVVPWVDAHLPTIASRRGRVLAGLSAGGYGAVDIGLRNPELFGRIASWSGYFHPLRDGPFKHADASTLAANDPWEIIGTQADRLRRDGIAFFLSTGPPHSRWEKPAETIAFARTLRRLGFAVRLMTFQSARGHWGFEFHAGLRWAFGSAP
jgi:enterochelin esterase-like enzyme